METWRGGRVRDRQLDVWTDRLMERAQQIARQIDRERGIRLDWIRLGQVTLDRQRERDQIRLDQARLGQIDRQVGRVGQVRLDKIDRQIDR